MGMYRKYLQELLNIQLNINYIYIQSSWLNSQLALIHIYIFHPQQHMANHKMYINISYHIHCSQLMMDIRIQYINHLSKLNLRRKKYNHIHYYNSNNLLLQDKHIINFAKRKVQHNLYTNSLNFRQNNAQTKLDM